MTLKKINLNILLSIAVIIILFACWFFLSKIDYFKVKKILVNQKPLTYQQKRMVLKEDINKDIYGIDLDEIIKRVQSIYASQAITITRIYPDTLSIKLIENQFIAFVKIFYPNNQKSTIFGVNTKGRAIDYFSAFQETKNNYPFITVRYPVELTKDRNGKRFENAQVLTVLKSLNLIKKLDYSFFRRIKKINLYQKPEENHLIIQDLKTRFYFGHQLMLTDLIKIASLEEDLATRETFRRVDLRFDDIVGRN